MKKVSLFTLLTFTLILPFFVIAETDEMGTTTTTPDIAVQPTDGIFDCFENYRFGSINIASAIPTPNTTAGTKLHIPLIVTNNNDYPIVGGDIYVKVLKADDTTVDYHNGPTIVEQTYLVKDLKIGAHQSQTVNFSWQVPQYTTPGKYRLATYFAVNEKFNYAGLSFTNDIVASLIDFNINSENTNTVYFNKSNIKINGKIYNPAGFIAQINDGKSANIQVEIVNKSENLERFPVTWYVYSWDGLSESNFLFSQKDGAYLKPGEKKTLTLKIPDNSYPVYYVIARGEYKDTRNIINIRYSRNDATGIRLNSSSIKKYPIKAGEENQAYACFHSMSSALIDNTKLVIAVKDDKGNLVTENTYSGDISGNVTGFRKVFTSDKDLYNFTLESRLYRDGQLVDSADIKYTCSDLQTTGCPTEKTSQGFLSKIFTSLYFIYGLIIFVLLLTVTFIILKKIKK